MKTLILLIGIVIGLYLGADYVMTLPVPPGHHPVEAGVEPFSGTVVGKSTLGEYPVIRLAIPGSGRVVPVVPQSEYSLGQRISVDITTYSFIDANGQRIRLYHEARLP